MIYCYIPARGGSKGIKKKNLVELKEKPLLQHSIEFAVELKDNNLISEIFVSSDSEEILNFSSSFQNINLIKRPKSLSGSESRSVDGIIDLIRKTSYIKDSDAIMTLQPTSPYRSVLDFQKAIRLFNTENLNSVISVSYDETLSLNILYTMTKNNRCIPLDINHNKGIRRQDNSGLLVRNGSLYLTKVRHILEKKSLIGDETGFVQMNRKNSINIDTYEDLEFARQITI
mgnify:CR=1 FL=1